MNQKLLKALNQEQKKAVSFSSGPLLVLAGPGSGKTKTLIYRACWLIKKKKIPGKKILLLTFTNKAAEEMKKRLIKLLKMKRENPANLPWAGTFHSFSAALLRKEGKYLALPLNFVIFDENDQLVLIKSVLAKLDLSSSRFKPTLVLNIISSLKNEMISPKNYQNFCSGFFQKKICQIYFLYQKFLKENQALDFDDLLFKAVKLLQKKEKILKKYQERFPFILIDEYHDTNQVQYQLIKLLAAKYKNLTAVADCSQSIYSWRGADFRNVLRLKNDFPNLTILNLEQNYRSQPIILDAASALISHNQSHPTLKLWTKKPRKEKIKLVELKTEKEEALFIVNTIKSRLKNFKEKYQDFAVLYRTNAQSRILEEAFLAAAIPYALYGGIRFYERREIKDCLAFLRQLYNPQDSLAYERIKKLGKKKLKDFLAWQKKINVRRYSPATLLKKVLKKLDYWSLFSQSEEDIHLRKENVRELFSLAWEYPNLDEFLQKISLVQQENLLSKETGFAKNNKNANRVSLLTIHSAKGLEFKNVFLVGLEEGLFPHSRSLENKEELEEERRLAYVAITRTKENLFLTYTRQRLYFGARNYNQVSRFIREIPANLLELINI